MSKVRLVVTAVVVEERTHAEVAAKYGPFEVVGHPVG